MLTKAQQIQLEGLYIAQLSLRNADRTQEMQLEGLHNIAQPCTTQQRSELLYSTTEIKYIESCSKGRYGLDKGIKLIKLIMCSLHRRLHVNMKVLRRNSGVAIV